MIYGYLFWGISCEIVLWLVLSELTYDKSAWFQVMAWCQYLSQCWSSPVSECGVARSFRKYCFACLNSYTNKIFHFHIKIIWPLICVQQSTKRVWDAGQRHGWDHMWSYCLSVTQLIWNVALTKQQVTIIWISSKSPKRRSILQSSSTQRNNTPNLIAPMIKWTNCTFSLEHFSCHFKRLTQNLPSTFLCVTC